MKKLLRFVALSAILSSTVWTQVRSASTLVVTLSNPNGGPKTREVHADGTITERTEFTQPVTGDLTGQFTERSTQTFTAANEQGLAQISTLWKLETSNGTMEGSYLGLWDRSQNVPRVSEQSGFILATSQAYSSYQQKAVSYRFVTDSSGASAMVTFAPYTALNNDLLGDVAPVAQAGVFNAPIDATPDPDGTSFYFTAQSRNGPAVFNVDIGDGSVRMLSQGAPFVAPRGLASSPLGALYVADTKAGDDGGGRIFSLGIGGTAGPQVIRGTEGYVPRALEIGRENGADVIYFIGRDPSDGMPGIFEIPATIVDGTSNTPTPIWKGDPLKDPDSITVSRTGTIFVSDRGSGIGNSGSVYMLLPYMEQGNASIKHYVCPSDGGFRPGNPAGIALTQDESRLFVSSLDAQGAAQVRIIDLTAFEVGTANKGIGQNHAAGGLHRAHFGDMFAWANSTNDGSVYQVPIRPSR